MENSCQKSSEPGWILLAWKKVTRSILQYYWCWIENSKLKAYVQRISTCADDLLADWDEIVADWIAKTFFLNANCLVTKTVSHFKLKFTRVSVQEFQLILIQCSHCLANYADCFYKLYSDRALAQIDATIFFVYCVCVYKPQKTTSTLNWRFSSE